MLSMVKSTHYTKEMYEKDKRLIAQIEHYDVNADSTFVDLEQKYRLLTDYGYKSLNGGGALEEVSDARLGNAFRNIYGSAVKNTEHLEGALAFVQKLARSAKPETRHQGDLFGDLGLVLERPKGNPYSWEDEAHELRKRFRFI